MEDLYKYEKELYEKGVITEDEYNDKKERLLSK